MEKLEKHIVHPLIYNDKENGLHTIFTLEKGGPIISDPSQDVVKEKFVNALKLAVMIKKILTQ